MVWLYVTDMCEFQWRWIGMCPFWDDACTWLSESRAASCANCASFRNAKKRLANWRHIHTHCYNDPRPKEQPEKFQKCQCPMHSACESLRRSVTFYPVLQQSGLATSLISAANVFSHSLVSLPGSTAQGGSGSFKLGSL